VLQSVRRSEPEATVARRAIADFRNPQTVGAHAPGVRAVAVLVAILVAGCGTPTDGGEPARPSVVLHDRLVDGERLDHNTTVLVSGLPEATAPIVSPDRPMNCFRIETDTGEKTYLGGAVLNLTWTPSVAATANLTVTASNLPSASWRASGPSPLVVRADASDEQAVELPMTVAVESSGQAEFGFRQEVRVHIVVGLLESLIDSLVVKQTSCP
jgi:hypothetical protein